MDPNDGYASRVPGHTYRLPIINKGTGLTKPKTYYIPNYKTVQILSSTPASNQIYPSSEAPRYQINTQSAPLYEYETVPVTKYPSTTSESYRPVPAIATTQSPPRQHLTETTQIQPPTVSTYHPNHHKEHYNVYKVQKLNSVPKYKTTVLNRVPVVDEPHYIVRPHAPTVTPSPPSLSPEHVTASVAHSVDYGFNSSSISAILKKLQDTNHLPQTITPDNIDNSIRTLVKILNNLKKSQKVADPPSQHYQGNDDYDDGSKSEGGKEISTGKLFLYIN